MTKKEPMTKTCRDCKHFYEYVQRKAPCCWSKPADNACYEFELKVITNGDKIRQLSNVEFLKYLGFIPCAICPARTGEECNKGSWSGAMQCQQNWLNWLNAPAKSEGDDE